jgi:type I restriction enzyme S subunit
LVISRFIKQNSDPLFYCHYFNSERGRAKFKEIETGSTMKHLNVGDMKPLLVPSPPLPEQRAIAEALSDMDDLLAGLDKLIAKKRDLKQAAMQQLLTGKTRLPGFSGEWEETTLGQIGECIIGLTYKPENVVEHGLLVLRSSNVQNGQLAYDDNVYVNLEVANHLHTRLGDILVCVRNGSRTLIGKCALIENDSEGLTFGAFMSVYRTKYWRFVVHAFRADNIQSQIRDNIGATINQITNKNMKAFRLKLPPEDEQTAIAEVLSDMDTEIATLEARLEKTRTLKQGMMQELLTGRIRLV